MVKLPFITKDDLAGDPTSVVADKIAVWHTTSGTTGRPTIVGFSSKDLETQIGIEARNLQGIGLSANDVVQNLTPYGMFFAGICLHQAAQRIGASVVPAGKTPSARQQIQYVQIFKPTALIGIPQFIMRLGNMIGRDDPRSVKLIYALGEPLANSVRDRLSELWNAEVYEGYGLTEGASGAECDEHEGVHWPEDHCHVEVVDPETGDVLGPGEEGELVYTTLSRTGTISIRFRSRDYSAVIADECACGSKLLRVIPPKFRLDDLMKVKGTLISPYQLDEAVFSRPGIQNYLCVIERGERSGDVVRLFVEGDSADLNLRKDMANRFGEASWISPQDVFIVRRGSIPSIGRKGLRVIDLRSSPEYSDEIRELMSSASNI